jgi:putative ABC transport system permease protein
VNVFKFLPYVLKSLLRHRARTLLTVSGTAVAMFVFAFIGAAQQGLVDMTRGKQAERTLVVFQANRFCPSTSRLPQDYETTIRKIKGVEDVVPMQVYVNNCRASLDLVLFHGLPPEKLTAARELRLLSGSVEDFYSRGDAALAGHAVARRRGLAPGQKFTIGEISVTVVGTFAAPTAAEENVLYTHLDFLQRARGRNVGEATLFEVRLTEDADAGAVCREIDAAFRDGRVPTDTRPKGVFQAGVVGDLVELVGWANFLGYACVGLVLSLVGTTTLMAVQDRVREHAVLQAVGFTPGLVFALVMAEGVIVTAAGGLAGVGAALGVLWWSGIAVGTEGVTIALSPSWWLLAQGALVSFAVGVLASLAPAWSASSAEVVTALRAA